MPHRASKSAAAVLLVVFATVVRLLLAWNADPLRRTFTCFVSWQGDRTIDVRDAATSLS
jgi:hypothetical protein